MVVARVYSSTAELAPDGEEASSGAPKSAVARELRQGERRGRVKIALCLSGTRIVAGLAFAHMLLTVMPQAVQHYPGGLLRGGAWFAAFDRWDSAYYLRLAAHSYPHSLPVLSAFFPGYPLAVRAVHDALFGSVSYLQTATAVSWAAFMAASVLIFDMVGRRFGNRTAVVATALYCWFPTSLFFLSPYSEALFTLEIVAVLWLLERRRFMFAAAVAGYASATSPESLALSAAIVLCAWLAGRGLVRATGYGLVSGVGFLAYGGFLWGRYGDPLEFMSAEKSWHRSENLPFVGLYRNVLALRDFFVGSGPAPSSPNVTYANIRAIWLLDDAMLLVASLFTLYLVVRLVRSRDIPVSWVVVSVVIVGIAACTTIYPYGSTHFASTEAEARFVSVAIPLFGAVSLWLRRRPGLTTVMLGTSIVAALFFQALYNLGYWVT